MAIMNTSDWSQTLGTDKLGLKKKEFLLYKTYIKHMNVWPIANYECEIYIERQIAQLFQIEDYMETSKKMLNEPL